MKKVNYILIFAFVTVIAVIWGVNAFLQPNPIGVFTAKNNINTIDTLFIFNDSTYERRIYNTGSNEIAFRNKGKWKSIENRIVFYDFYPNNDEEIDKDFNNNDLLLVFSVKLEKSCCRVVFDYYEGSENFRYYKSFF